MSWLVSAWQCLGVAENLLHLPLATLIVVLSANKISYRKCLNILRLGYRIGFQRGLRLRNAEGLAPQVGFELTSFRITAERPLPIRRIRLFPERINERKRHP